MPDSNGGGDGERTDDIALARRSLLGALAAAGVAGCASDSGGSETADPTETAEPTPTATAHPDGTPADVPSGWGETRDPYYGQLANELNSDHGLPGGEFVYAADETEAMSGFSIASEVGSATGIDVGDDVPFSTALRVEVAEETENPWDVTMIGTVEDRPVAEGDVLLGIVYLRGPDESETEPTLQFVSKDDDHPSSNMVRGVSRATPPGEWVRYYVPIQYDYDADAGTWRTELFLGFGPQTVDVGGIALVDFDQNILLENLPSGPASDPSENESGTDDWEAAAEERIAEHRTSELDIQVTDADGDPVAATDISVSMVEHDFGFGTAVNADHLLNETDQGDPYRRNISELFNTGVLENHHKWRFFEESQDLSDGATQWLRGEGMDVRGHVCLYNDIESWAVPSDVVRAMGVEWEDNGVTDPELDPEYVERRTKEHLREIIEYYGDDIDEWDVVNELTKAARFIKAINGVAGTDETELDDVDPLQSETLGEWFDIARDAAPEDTTLAVNDYNVLAGPYDDTRDDYETQIEFLAEREAGLDSVGLQCHFSQSGALTPEETLSALDRYAENDVRLRITEFDMADSAWGQEDRADFLYQFLKTVYSHPAVDDFLVWGIDDGTHWQDDAPFYTTNWEAKPPLDAYRSLVFDEWWTERSGTTDADGQFALVGHHGEYAVTATVDGQEVTQTVTLPEGGATVEVSPEA